MDLVHEPSQARQETIVINADFAAAMAADLLGCSHLDGDETDTAARPCEVIGDGIVSHKPFVTRRARGHCRHDNAIGDFKGPDACGGEQDVHWFSVSSPRERGLKRVYARLRLTMAVRLGRRERAHSTAISPPSRSMVAPCSQLARADTMNVIRSATSSTVPNRVMPVSRQNCSRIFASGAPLRSTSARMRRHCRSVSTRLGCTQLTRTPSVLPRSARHLVKAATAALTELPMVKRCSGLRPLVPPIATSEPRRSLSSGQAARASRTCAKNFSA